MEVEANSASLPVTVSPRPKRKYKKKAKRKNRAARPSQSSQSSALPPAIALAGPSQPSSDLSSKSTEPRAGEPLPDEAAAAFKSVPDFIGEPAAAGPGSQGAAPELAAADIRGLLPEITFDERDVRDVLEEMFESAAERFHSDHWKLTERQSRMLGRPTAQLLGSLWQKVGDFLPDILAGWCESTPGLAGVILAGGIVIGPKVAKQFAIARDRKKNVPQPVGSVRPAPKSGPVTVSPRPVVAGPVGVCATGPVEPLDDSPLWQFGDYPEPA